MLHGRLAVVGCPILEDEIIHLICSRAEADEILIVEDENSASMIRKLKRRGVRFSTIDLSDIATIGKAEGFSLLIIMKSMGLHEEPKELRKAVMETLVSIQESCDAILLFYGLCGNAFNMMEEFKEQLSRPVCILRDRNGNTVDDCIAVPLGGTEGYLRLLKRYPGVFYMTPAWAENWRELINKMEFTKGLEFNDLEMMKMLFEMAGYSLVLKIDTGLGNDDDFDQKIREFMDIFSFEQRTLESEHCSLDVIHDAFDEAIDHLRER